MSKDLVVNEEERALAVSREQEDFFSDMGAEDYSVPFVRVLADISAPVKDGIGKAGEIYNSGTGESSAELEVVVVGKPEKTITVRTDDGEFVASHPYSSELLAELTDKQEGLKRWDVDGNSVYETWNYFIMDVETGEVSICSMLSSNFTIAKAWNSRIRAQRKFAPSQMRWKLSTKEVPNGKKSYWMFAAPLFKGETTEEQAQMVAFAKEMVSSANVDHSKGHEPVQATGADESDF